jgi:hypothetical protein
MLEHSMKVRWTRNSVRLRITPGELRSLQQAEAVLEEFAIPGSGSWSAEIRPGSAESTLSLEQSKLCFFLTDADLQKLCNADEEGVYFHWKDGANFVYFIEKDFPCAHPRTGNALEPPSETFKGRARD